MSAVAHYAPYSEMTALMDAEDVSATASVPLPADIAGLVRFTDGTRVNSTVVRSFGGCCAAPIVSSSAPAAPAVYVAVSRTCGDLTDWNTGPEAGMRGAALPWTRSPCAIRAVLELRDGVPGSVSSSGFMPLDWRADVPTQREASGSRVRTYAVVLSLAAPLVAAAASAPILGLAWVADRASKYLQQRLCRARHARVTPA